VVLNPQLIGKTYPTSAPYVVGREKVREFATAIGDANPAYHDLDAARALGYRDVIAPPTFAFVLTMQAMATAMFDPVVALDYARVVHGSQSFEAVRPIVAGDEVVVDALISAVDSSGRHEFLTVEAEVRTVLGEPITRTHSTIVSRGTGAAA